MADDLPGFRLGCIPDPPSRPRPHLADYLNFRALPKAPAARMWLPDVPYGYFWNDRLGTCTCACPAHALQVWTADATGTPATIPDSAILQMYEVIGHYVPGRPETDQGASFLDALSYFRVNGIAGHRDVAYAYVVPAIHERVKASINLFGPVAITIALPFTARAQMGGLWDVPPGGPVGLGLPGSWGYHAMIVGGYDSVYYGLPWTSIQKMSEAFWDAYVMAVYPILDLEWLKRNGKSPSGMNIAQLRADINTLLNT